MLYAALDMTQKKVTDIILGGDAGHLFQELIDLYNRMVPPDQRRESFSSLDEAKRETIRVLHAAHFPETVAKPAAQPAQVQPQAPRPVPSVPAPVAAATGQITPPWARSDTSNGTNPNPAPQPARPTPPPVTQVARSEHPAEEQEHHDTRQSDGPVARARKVFEEMQGAQRKDVIDACAKLGIKRSTASTQYQAWKKAKEEAGEWRNPSTGMPQLAPGTYLGNNVAH